MCVYEFLHWYYSHKLWCKLYLYLSHLLNQFFKFRFILYKRICSILPISHHCTPFKILLIYSARYFTLFQSMPNPGLWMRVSYKGLKLLLCIRHSLLFQLTYQRFVTMVSVPEPNKSLFECFNTLCYIRMQCIILTSITLHYRINPFAIFFTII